MAQMKFFWFCFWIIFFFRCEKKSKTLIKKKANNPRAIIAKFAIRQAPSHAKMHVCGRRWGGRTQQMGEKSSKNNNQKLTLPREKRERKKKGD